MTAPKRGDRVRVVLEGEVSGCSHDGFSVSGPGTFANFIHPTSGHVVSVEILPPPEPEWQPGDVVRDAVGGDFRRTNNGWWEMFGTTYRHIHDLPVRPLTRLVPEVRS